MLAGEPPFTGPTAQAIIAKRFSGEVPRVRQVRPSVPEALEQTILRALAPVAADRFATAADLARALASSSTPAAASTMPAATTTAPFAVPVAAPALPRRRRPVPIAAITLALGFLIGLGVLFAWRHGHPGPEGAAGAAPKRIAVLPFDNLGDSADAYFADGVTDEVRGKLASLPGLQVTASNSSSEYKKTTKTPQQIGQELGVQYLLVGKVRWEKVGGGTSRVRVSPELVQVTTASTKWQQPFEASLTDHVPCATGPVVPWSIASSGSPPRRSVWPSVPVSERSSATSQRRTSPRTTRTSGVKRSRADWQCRIR